MASTLAEAHDSFRKNLPARLVGMRGHDKLSYPSRACRSQTQP